jgi:S-DNA-T family DNA segregation ATPase FtsK/SpoIIIE
MPRTAKNSSKRSKRKEIEEEELEGGGLLSSLSPDTVRGVSGVLLFVLGILLVLSGVGMAGIAGEKMYAGLTYLVGIGYVLLPVLFVGAAISLLRRVPLEDRVGPVRLGGALLFFVSTLGIVGVLANERAGLLGGLVAKPLLQYLETVATLVLLAGLVVVSLLLLFDTALWVHLYERARGLVGKKDDSEADAATEDVEPTVHEWPDEEADASDEEEVVEEDYEEDEADDAVDTEEEDELPAGSVSPSSAPPELPSEYAPPPLSILESDRGKPNVGDTKARANLIRRTLQHFKIPVEMDEIIVGPTVTRYSLKPAEGVRLNKIVALQSNLELALAASPIRIEAPIPGKSLVGIEVPNTGKSIVGLSGLLAAPEFNEQPAPLMVTLGKDIAGSAHYANIAKMPHCLVAGTTGSGKSVMMHAIISSLLYRNGPERLRFIMVDPKRVELTLYDNIPHLLTPVITEAKACIQALKWATKEMDRRYDVLRSHKVQDISAYHSEVVAPALAELEELKNNGRDADDFEMPELMPYTVVIIDELADIMSAYPRELEAVIVRLAQMSRAVGIHLILATQRPEAKVITGLIKANMPTRIAFKVNTLIDSRVILDQSGAEKLLGAGDMLFLSGEMPKPRRIQSPFISTNEVKKITQYLIKHNDYVLDSKLDLGGDNGGSSSTGGNSMSITDAFEDDEEGDELYEDARLTVIDAGKASTSYLQRKLGIGYGRAAKLVDLLEARGVVGPANGSKPREILVGNGEEKDEEDAEEPDEEERT